MAVPDVVRNPGQGRLVDTAFGSGATVYSPIVARSGPSITFHVKATQAGTAVLQSVDPADGTAVDLATTPGTLTADTEQPHLCKFPCSLVRVKYINTNAAAGTLSVRISE